MIFYFIVHLIIIGLALYLSRPKPQLSAFFWGGSMAKIACGILLGWIYWFQAEGGDTIAFHDQATELFQLGWEEYLHQLFSAEYPVFKGEARNEFFVKILSALYWITNGNYWLSGVYLSLISFAGSWYFVSRIHHYYPNYTFPAAASFLFLPSATFWTAGVMKDTLVFAAITYLFALALDYRNSNAIKKKDPILAFIALSLLFYLKIYLLAVAGLALGLLAGWLMITQLPISKSFKIVTGSAVGALLVFAVTQLNMNLHFNNLPEAIYTNYQSIINRTDSALALSFHNLEPTWTSLVAHLPLGLLAGVGRPFIWETNLYLLLPSFEHFLLIALLAYNSIKMPIPKNDLALIGMLYCLMLATILPLTTPNFGSLIRYEAAYMPLLLFILLLRPFNQFFSKS